MGLQSLYKEQDSTHMHNDPASQQAREIWEAICSARNKKATSMSVLRDMSPYAAVGKVEDYTGILCAHIPLYFEPPQLMFTYIHCRQLCEGASTRVSALVMGLGCG